MLTVFPRPTPALTYKWGYDSLEDLLENNQKDYSLVLNGILDGNHTNVLMVNVSRRVLRR